jgi:HPt (histidine-containing phosphotransfer) domain-containing protein
MANATIDLATFHQLQETTGAEFVSELVGAFLEEAPGILEDLRSAYAERDAERFKRAAHSLKSNANTFGALAFGAKARELELAGLARVLEAKGDPVSELSTEYARVAAALSELRNA